MVDNLGLSLEQGTRECLMFNDLQPRERVRINGPAHEILVLVTCT